MNQKSGPAGTAPWPSFRPEHQYALALPAIKEFWRVSWGPILYQVSLSLPIVLCSYFIGTFGDAFALSIFGLSNTYVNLAFNGFLFGIAENLGVHTSKYFAQNNLRAVRAILGKFFTMLFLLVVFAMIMFENSESILLFFGFEKSVALATYQFLHASRWYVLFMAFNFPAVSFLISQQVTSPLIYINLITIVVLYFSGHYLIISENMKEMGVPWARLFQELSGFVCYVYLLWKHSDRRALWGFSLRDIFEGYGRYLREVGVTVSNFYSEFVCFEVNIYFVGLLHNLTEMALWITLINSVGGVFFISIAFSNTIRTAVARLVGLRQAEQARAVSIHMFIYIAMFAYIFTMLILIFRYQIGWIFTGNEYLTEKMAEFFQVYAFNIYPTLTLYSCNTIFRILDCQEILFRLNSIYNVTLTITLSYLLCFVFDLKALGINIAFTISKSVIVAIMFYYIYWKVEWRSASGMVSRQIDPLEKKSVTQNLFEE